MAKKNSSSQSERNLPDGVTVTEVKPSGRKSDFFIARHEPSRTQFTGDTKDEALEKLNDFLAGQE
jgi:hypothetical protein